MRDKSGHLPNARHAAHVQHAFQDGNEGNARVNVQMLSNWDWRPTGGIG